MSLNPVNFKYTRVGIHNSSYNNEGMSIVDVNDTNKRVRYIYSAQMNTNPYDIIIDEKNQLLITHNNRFNFMRLTNIYNISLGYLERDLPEDLDEFKNNIIRITNRNANRLNDTEIYALPEGVSIEAFNFCMQYVLTLIGKEKNTGYHPKAYGTGIYKYIDNCCDTVNTTLTDISTKIGHDEDKPNNINATGIYKLIREMVVKDPSLQKLWDDFYYQPPVPINYTVQLSNPTFMYGSKPDVHQTITLTVNNYIDNLTKVALGDNQTLSNGGSNIKDTIKNNTGHNYTTNFSALQNIPTSDVRVPVIIETNYKDAKNNGPSNINTSVTMKIIKPQYITKDVHGLNTIIDIQGSSDILKPTNILTYGRVDNTTKQTISLGDGPTEYYIYIISYHNIDSDKTQIYETGTSPLGTGGLVNLGVVKLDLVSDSDRHEPVDYYVYRSENPLTGNWTVIV